MATADGYRLSVDFTLADQVAGANGKVRFIPSVKWTDAAGLALGTSGNPIFVSMSAGGGAVTIADGADVAEGATSATAYSSSSGSAAGTVVGILKGLYVGLIAMSAKLPASLGIKAPSFALSVGPTGLEYETVAASQTAQALGATGATGDYLSHVVIQPATVGAGTVTILDNSTTILTFTTGTLSDLRPITVPVGAFSVSGAWKVTTGANVSVLGVGDFT